MAKTLLESHPLIGQSAPGPAPGYIKNHEFRVRSQTLEDGTLIQPTDDARKSVQRMLQKAKYAEGTLQKAMRAFDHAPADTKVKIATGLEVVKWSIQSLKLDLSKSRLMNPLIPAKTAYEFLALLVGSAIYDGAPQLTRIRHSLREKVLDPEAIMVERLSSDKYEPFHGICFEGNDPYTKVQIRLFGWLAFRVHFLRLAISAPRLLYTHRLDTGEEYARTINGPQGS